MTGKEAIYTLQNAAYLGTDDEISKIEQAVEIAVKAIRKDDPKVVVSEAEDLRGVTLWSFFCPECGYEFDIEEIDDCNYCPNCGQAQSWKEIRHDQDN